MGNDTDYKKTLDGLTAEFAPQKNKIFETIKFRRQRQRSEETVAQYCTRLRDMAATCEFHDTNREILTQIILTCSSGSLRKWALEKELELKDLLEKAQALELSRAHATEIENEHRTTNQYVNKVQQKPLSKVNTANQNRTEARKCFACGKSYPHTDAPCPAAGRKCYNCGGVGHLAGVCTM